jgi:hypothetical protein
LIFTGALLLALDPFASQPAFGAPAEKDPVSPAHRSLTADQIAVLLQVAKGTQVTPELAGRFWKPLRADGLFAEDVAQFSDLLELRNAWESAQAYKRELWECARLSYGARKVVRTPALDALEAGRSKEDAAGAKTILEAAAQHKPWPVPGRDPIELTPEVIDATITNVDSMSANMVALLNPELLRRDRSEVRMTIEMPAGGAADAEMARAAAETLRRRIQVLDVEGSAEVTAGNRVEVRLPRVADPQRITRVLEANGSFALRLVRYPDSHVGVVSREKVLGHFAGRLPDDLEVLPGQRRDAFGKVTDEGYYAVERRSLTEGHVVKATTGLTREDERVVFVELEPAAAASLGEASERNAGRFLAVVVDGRVVSAPKIDGRLGEILLVRGYFISNEAQEELAALLSGALPPGIKIVDERVVGAAKD